MSAPQLPAGTARLFEDPEAVDPVEHAPYLLARILEDGDRHDLRWLFATLGEAGAAAWLRERGGRQLSTRSRAFWEVVLGAAAAPPDPVARELWPL
jgi:hypothetical protein